MTDELQARLDRCDRYIKFLEAYARDWFEFLPHNRFNNQNSWYAFRQVVTATIRQVPLNKSQAIAGFKANGEAQLNLALEKGIFLERKNPENRRETLIEASPAIVETWLQHIERTKLTYDQK
jgi:hypothetical protein